jgi:serine/threonine protein kinase
MPTRNQVFISYAHEDAAWRDAFAVMLAPAVRRGSITLWSDGSIAAGKDWAQSIDQALQSASAAILLVTPHFLQSEFINEIELARLLSLAKTKGVALHWVPVSASLYAETPLHEVQAAWDPAAPLDQLSAAEQSAAVYKICTEIVENSGFLPKVTGRRRKNLPQELQARLGDRYEVGAELGAGRFSIVYQAHQRNPKRTVAVKLFVASEFDDWALKAFEEAVARGAELNSPAFIRIIEHSMDATPEFLVTEFVRGEPLSKYLRRHPQGVPLGRVRSILLDLVRSIEEIHDRGWLRGELCASNILIEPTGSARISTVDLSTVLSQESLMAGNFSVDRESLTYMTPERFFGHQPTPLSDQFSLGLIATELLGGDHVPRVNCPSDLEQKRPLFRDLESSAGAWARRSPEFAGIVSRLLRTNPEERWPSMTDVRRFLRDIDIQESAEDRNRSAAKTLYLRLQSGGGDRSFFDRFYQNLFEVCPEVQAHFSATNMPRQHTMLNRAIQLLLDFHSDSGCRQLRELSTRHAAFGLTGRHYQLFLDVLVKTIEQLGVADPSQLAAWRGALSPGIEFMRHCQGQAAPEPTAAEV